MDTNKFPIIDLLFIIAQKFKEKNGYAAAKTKLIKLAYLAEVFYTRLQRERLTEAKWYFWHYGPYLKEYNNLLQAGAFEIEETDEDFHPVKPSKTFKPSQITLNARIAITRAMEFSDLDLNKILDFVYFDTEPMMNAKSRGEELDFGCVLPESEYKITDLNLSKESKKHIAARLAEWEERHGRS
jgi:uncharacterized phage-associated protein